MVEIDVGPQFRYSSTKVSISVSEEFAEDDIVEESSSEQEFPDVSVP